MNYLKTVENAEKISERFSNFNKLSKIEKKHIVDVVKDSVATKKYVARKSIDTTVSMMCLYHIKRYKPSKIADLLHMTTTNVTNLLYRHTIRLFRRIVGSEEVWVKFFGIPEKVFHYTVVKYYLTDATNIYDVFASLNGKLKMKPNDYKILRELQQNVDPRGVSISPYWSVKDCKKYYLTKDMFLAIKGCGETKMQMMVERFRMIGVYIS